ncbi:DUF1642 domain-containing protein [Enterococcus sp. LJL128]
MSKLDEKISDWTNCLRRFYRGEEQSQDVLIRAMLTDLGEIKAEHEKQKKRVEVPPVVANYLSIGDKSLNIAFLVANKYNLSLSDIREGELKQWLREVSMEDLLSLANGYAVKQEPLYYVVLAENKGGFKYVFLNKDGTVSHTNNKECVSKFTESEIKAIDERYWAFAVPVEEETK